LVVPIKALEHKTAAFFGTRHDEGGRGLDKGLFGFGGGIVVVCRSGFLCGGGEESGTATIAGVVMIESVNGGELLSEKHGHCL